MALVISPKLVRTIPKQCQRLKKRLILCSKNDPVARNSQPYSLPSPDEMILAQRQTRQKETQLAFLIQLKTFQRLGYVAKINDIP